MNIVQLQDQLKNFSQDQLVREMQMPSGNAPQFLILGEIMRRKRMQDDFTAQQAKGDQGTVAQEAVAAAGVPQGGIADMARAMAPSTDMTQNTGVQAMYAGGPVKKMKAGGKAETDPVVIAMANRAGMSVSKYLEALGEEEAARVEAAAAQRADRSRMMAMEPIGDSITMPTQADLDRRFQEEQFAFGASRPMVAPTAIDMPVVPSVPGRIIGAPAAGLASISPALPAAPAADMAPRTGAMLTPEQLAASAAAQPSVAPVDAGVLPPPPPTAAVPAQPVTRTAPRAAGIGSAAVVPGSVDGGILSDIVDPALSGLGEFGRAISGETVEERDARRAAEAAAEAARKGPAFEDRGREQSPTTLEEAVKAQEDAKKAADEAEKAKTTTTTPSGGAGGAGGAGGMSSYEQELMSMLQKREKAAEQDKWLALAQVGLNMMSSRQPTLLGAVGEAGLKGVEAVRGARDQYDKDRLELLGALEKSRMARAAAASRGSGGASDGGLFSLSAGQGRLLTQIGNDIERLDALIANAKIMPPATPEAEMALVNAQKERDRKMALWNTLVYGGGATGGADSGIPDLSDQD